MRLHSWLTEKCEVRESPLSGIGVFALQAIANQELVAIWGGVIYSSSEILGLCQTFPHFLTHPIEVAEGFYLGSTSLTSIDDAERFNHSCNPNVGVKGQIVVISRRSIAQGEELTLDYETIATLPAPFPCRCADRRCRKLIDGSALNTTEFRDQHTEFLSWHVTEMSQRQRAEARPT